MLLDGGPVGGMDAAAFVRRLEAVPGVAVQLRAKGVSRRELYQRARVLGDAARAAGVPFLVNDAVDVALALPGTGVHLGQEDLPLEMARRLLGRSCLLGASVRTPEQAREAVSAGADYLGVGAVFPSPTKPHAPVIGLEGFRKVRVQVECPVVAIGGITRDRVAQVRGAGADAVAVVSAVAASQDPVAACRDFVAAFSCA